MGSFLTVAIETGSDGLTPFDAYEDQTAGRLDALLARLDEVDDQGMRERILLALQRDVRGGRVKRGRMPSWMRCGTGGGRPSSRPINGWKSRSTRFGSSSTSF